jgi:hypothetical protein
MTATRAKHIHKLLLPINKKVKDINWGGCGIFAKAFANMMIELGFKPTIMGVYCNNRPEMTHRSNLKNIRQNRTKAYSEEVEIYDHYVVQIGKFYFDSEFYNICCDGVIEGIEEGKNIDYYPIGKMDVDDLSYLINNNTSSWNCRYKKHKENSKLFKYLSDIKPKIIKS